MTKGCAVRLDWRACQPLRLRQESVSLPHAAHGCQSAGSQRCARRSPVTSARARELDADSPIRPPSPVTPRRTRERWMRPAAKRVSAMPISAASAVALAAVKRARHARVTGGSGTAPPRPAQQRTSSAASGERRRHSCAREPVCFRERFWSRPFPAAQRCKVARLPPQAPAVRLGWLDRGAERGEWACSAARQVCKASSKQGLQREGVQADALHRKQPGRFCNDAAGSKLPHLLASCWG